MRAPFRQQPLEALPEQPRRPHVWSQASAHETSVSHPFRPHRVTWRSYGAGPPLLLVHGLMTAGYSFRYLLEPLGQRFTLIIPDLPGAGDTEPVTGPYTPDAIGAWLRAFLTEIGVHQPPVIGNSLGGYLCLHALERDPSLFARVINLHSPGVPTPRMWALHAAMRTPGADRLLRALVHRDPERWVHRNVHYYDESLKSREETRIWAEPLRSNAGVAAFAAWLRDALDPRELRAFSKRLALRRDHARPITTPIHLIYAQTDPIVPPSVGDALRALLPTATFDALGDASHFAHVDATDAFLGACRPYLDEIIRLDDES